MTAPSVTAARLAIVLAILAAGLGLLALAPADATAGNGGGGLHSRTLPPCPEDTVIIGHGGYSGGLWRRYACVALDDISRLRIHRGRSRLRIRGYCYAAPSLRRCSRPYTYRDVRRLRGRL